MDVHLHRWKLGFNQCRLHHADRTCGASRYIPSRLTAFPTCYFPLWVSPPGGLGVLGGHSVLNLLLLWSDLVSAEVAHVVNGTFAVSTLFRHVQIPFFSML
jgi:hypothetical protein